MQCPNCRFENLPGVAACGRCRGSLLLATATIDVLPPRAGKWTKRFRNLSLRRQSFHVRDTLTANIPRLGGGHYESVPEGPLLLRLAVPGWSQIYCGRKVLGRAMLAAYVLFLAVAAVFIGTEFGSIMLGLALTCHAASIVDIVNASDDELLRRLSICSGCLVTVALAVYLPVGWLVTRIGVPRVIAADSPPFQTGDVVLYAPTTAGLISPCVGQLSLYRLPNVIIPGSRSNLNYRVAGERIDRILAGPGQHVVWHAGRLEVDGQPSAFAPVNPARCPVFFEVTTPPGHFVILPSTVGVDMGGLRNQADLNAISLIASRDILGKVYWRQQPLSRLGWIQ